MRELHWHATAAEWAFVTEGRVRTTVIDPQGCSETNDFEPGDIWYFPRGHGHVLETLGDKPCHFVLVFDNGYFSEFGTFSISDWIGHAPKALLAKNFGVPAATFDKFPKEEVYFAKGKIPPAVAAPPLQGWKKPPLTHKYSMMSQNPFETFDGGREWRVDGSTFPISTTMTGVVLEMEPGALRELHWHPNAAEWQYVLERPVQRHPVRLGRTLARGDARPGRRRLHPAGLRPLDRERRRRDGAHPHRASTAAITRRSISPSGSPAIRPTSSRRIFRSTPRCSRNFRAGTSSSPSRLRSHAHLISAPVAADGAPATGTTTWNHSTHAVPAVHARDGMVASSQPLAAQVGLQVLKDGGNAVDAAIAVAAMVNVTEPMMNGLGGDAFILVHWQGKLHGLNASGRCPQGMTRETFVTAGWTRMPQAGWGSVCVPGAPDGYFTLHDRFGSKKFADLVEPAAAYAEEGFPVGQKDRTRLGMGRLETAAERSIGRAIPDARAGRRRPAKSSASRIWRGLGAQLGKHGRDYFYAGDLARKIVAASDAGGGYLKMPDFAAQHSEWMDPISATYRGHRVVEMPPNGQGLIVLMALRILEGYDLAVPVSQRPCHGGAPDPRGAQALLRRRRALHRRSAIRHGRRGAAAVRCLHRLAAQSDPHGQRDSDPDRRCARRQHDLFHRGRQGPQRGVVHHQHFRRVRLGHGGG